MQSQDLSAITALAAVIISPVITIIVSSYQRRTSIDVTRMQITASTISTNRQDWINTLREIVAELQGVMAQIRMLSYQQSDAWHFDSRWDRLFVLQRKLELFLNPDEDDHKQLRIKVQMAISVLRCPPSPEVQKDEAYSASDITAATQAILKREWERVKAGEPVIGNIHKQTQQRTRRIPSANIS